MKTHLLIMNGPEKRDVILEECIRVSEPVFDCINIVQNGYCEGHSNELLDKYTQCRFKNFMGYIPAYQVLLNGIDEGDYLLVLDSDEIPSQDLLDFVKSRNFDTSYDTFGIQFMHYQYDNYGKEKYVKDSGFGFCPSRFFQYKPTLDCYTYLGAHQQYRHIDQKILLTDKHINHIKHDFALLLSSFAHGVNQLPSIGLESGHEYETIKFVRDKYQIRADFIYKNFENKELLESVRHDLRFLEGTAINVALEILLAVDFALSTKKGLVELYESDYNRSM